MHQDLSYDMDYVIMSILKVNDKSTLGGQESFVKLVLWERYQRTGFNHRRLTRSWMRALKWIRKENRSFVNDIVFYFHFFILQFEIRDYIGVQLQSLVRILWTKTTQFKIFKDPVKDHKRALSALRKQRKAFEITLKDARSFDLFFIVLAISYLHRIQSVRRIWN